MSTKDIAQHYVGEMADRAREGERVAITMRIDPSTKAMLGRLADATDQYVNAIIGDLLREAGQDLAYHLAVEFYGDDPDFEDKYWQLAHGANYENGEAA